MMSRLQSPRINGHTAPTCKLQSSYQSTRGASLAVRRYRDGAIYSLFSTQGSVAEWKSFQVEIGKSIAGFNVEIYAGSTYLYGSEDIEDIAIDNVI